MGMVSDTLAVAAGGPGRGESENGMSASQNGLGGPRTVRSAGYRRRLVKFKGGAVWSESPTLETSESAGGRDRAVRDPESCRLRSRG